MSAAWPEYDRAKLLACADSAQKAGKRRRAIAFYRRVLAIENTTPGIHAKLAPLLARCGARFDAWLSFRAAAEGYMRVGETDRALATYYEAAGQRPTDPEVWTTIARLQVARGSSESAVQALLQGRLRLARRRFRAEAIYLLRQVRDLAPDRVDSQLDLGRLLGKTRQRPEAMLLLQELSSRVRGRQLRKVRALEFRLSPGLHYGWLWLRAALGRPAKERRASSRRLLPATDARGRAGG